MMRLYGMLLWLALAASVVLAPSTAGADEAALGLLEQLRAEAANWAEGEEVRPIGVNARLRGVYPTDEVVRALAGWLRQPQSPDPVQEMHIRYQLLVPLMNASAEQVRRALPAITEFAETLKFEELPQYAAAELAGMKTGADGSLSPKAASEREKKAAAELAVVRNNMLVRRARAAVYALYLIANQPESDAEVLAAIATDLKNKQITYLDGLRAIEGRVTSLDRERGKAFYDAVKALYVQAGNEKVVFVDPARAKLAADEAGKFQEEERLPGADLADVVNLLATAGRQPAVVVPTGRPAVQADAPSGPQRER